MKQSQVEDIVTNIALIGFVLSFPESIIRTVILGLYFGACSVKLWSEINKEKKIKRGLI